VRFCDSRGSLTGTTGDGSSHLGLLPIDGTSLTQRQIYVAMREAFDFQESGEGRCDSRCHIDNPNVAFYVAGDATTIATTQQRTERARLAPGDPGQYEDNIYQWASETTNSAGATVTAMTQPPQRLVLDAGFFEVNFAHSIASFCAEISHRTEVRCVIAPRCRLRFADDTRRWVGFLPVYNAAGEPTRYGVASWASLTSPERPILS